MTAADRCRVWAASNVALHLSGEARGWVRGTSLATVSDRVTVSAWGSANVLAGGAAIVEARESAYVIAGGNATVKAFGAVVVRARGHAHVEAENGVAVIQHDPSVTVSRGTVTDAVRFENAEEWCAYYGVDVANGVATLYKAVDEEFNSLYGTSYRPGSEPRADDWDGGERECGGGLHFSPQPMFAVSSAGDTMRFVACPVRLEDIVVHPYGDYPEKVKARCVCAPVYEVDQDGTPIARPSAQSSAAPASEARSSSGPGRMPNTIVAAPASTAIATGTTVERDAGADGVGLGRAARHRRHRAPTPPSIHTAAITRR